MQLAYSDTIKNWNFPKIHAHSHVFDHICAKGALWAYTTKLFERLHRPLKMWYRFRTNFKKIEGQVGF